MITHSHLPTFHSAAVSLRLEVAGETLSVCTVEPDRLVLTRPRQFSEIDADLIVEIDRDIRRRSIRLQSCAEPTRTLFYTRR